jgi:regulator of PEP synthase PpsR (kinase-PPPase family)
MAEKPDVKTIGLNLGEDVVKTVISKVVRPYAEYYIEQSPNKIDDIILPFMEQLEKALLEIADKIDGEQG